MRHELITTWLGAATATSTPADLERVLAEARAELTEGEYLAFLAALSSANNLAAETNAAARRPEE